MRGIFNTPGPKKIQKINQNLALKPQFKMNHSCITNTTLFLSDSLSHYTIYLSCSSLNLQLTKIKQSRQCINKPNSKTRWRLQAIAVKASRPRLLPAFLNSTFSNVLIGNLAFKVALFWTGNTLFLAGLGTKLLTSLLQVKLLTLVQFKSWIYQD